MDSPAAEEAGPVAHRWSLRRNKILLSGGGYVEFYSPWRPRLSGF